MITFKGTSSNTYGVVTTLPFFVRAEKEVTYTHIEGSDRTIREEDGLIGYELNFEMVLYDNVNLDECLLWLSGEGQLILDEDSNKYVYVYLDRAVPYERFSKGIKRKVVKVSGSVLDPFRYALNETPTIITVSPTIITNSGTYYSEPILEIKGSGEVEVTINSKVFTYNFDGEPSVTIDSQQKEAMYSSLLRNRKMTGDFPILDIGVNTISWTGTITEITLTPNTRYL